MYLLFPCSDKDLEEGLARGGANVDTRHLRFRLERVARGIKPPDDLLSPAEEKEKGENKKRDKRKCFSKTSPSTTSSGTAVLAYQLFLQFQ
jgi:hypothetical protein